MTVIVALNLLKRFDLLVVDSFLSACTAFRGSPNIEMDEHTFLVNRERAVDYLNSLDKVYVMFLFILICICTHYALEKKSMLFF